ncbi:MAG TPA: polymer-forming cytoskeletal protein [Phnomibacter sp.]|nr:polymer-forming cytoskeletal protein [Phnomibacter sp.]
MFQRKTTEDLEKNLTKGATIIAAGTVFTGDIACNNDLRIDGEVIGHIKSASKVVVGAQGCVTGSIQTAQADVMGRVTGNIVATEQLCLRGEAQIEGDIYTKALSMDTGVQFNGQCRMTATAELAMLPAHDEEKKRKPEKAKLALAN